MSIQFAGATDIGNSRKTNEDCYAIQEDHNLFVVADGMGGHAAGEVASLKAAEFVMQHLKDHESEFSQRSQPGGYYRLLELAEDAVQAASQRLYHLACTNDNLAGMGTTLTMLMVVDSKAIMSHVGDSRLYLMRDDQVHLLSTDHTLANELRVAGGLTDEEARESHLQHVLTRSLGQQEMTQVESLLFDAMPGDTFLLCSDGLSNYFTTDELLERMAAKDLEQGCVELISEAKRRGGNDNVTTVLVRVPNVAVNDEVAPSLSALKKSSLFHGLPMNRLMRILSIAKRQQWSQGDEVVAAGKRLTGLYCVVSGQLDAGKRQFTMGGVFGETALLRSHPAPVPIVAAADTVTLFISGKEFDRLTRKVPKFGRRLLRRLAAQLSQQVVAAMPQDLPPGLEDTQTWGPAD